MPSRITCTAASNRKRRTLKGDSMALFTGRRVLNARPHDQPALIDAIVDGDVMVAG
jgi:hypothetical protein